MLGAEPMRRSRCNPSLRYQEHSEYFTLFWLAIILNEYDLEFMFRKKRNMQNLSNFKLNSLPIVMSRTEAQNGL